MTSIIARLVLAMLTLPLAGMILISAFAAAVMIATVCYRFKHGVAEPTGDFIRNTWWWTTHAPFAGLFVGRLMFGALAHAAPRR